MSEKEQSKKTFFAKMSKKENQLIAEMSRNPPKNEPYTTVENSTSVSLEKCQRKKMDPSQKCQKSLLKVSLYTTVEKSNQFHHKVVSKISRRERSPTSCDASLHDISAGSHACHHNKFDGGSHCRGRRVTKSAQSNVREKVKEFFLHNEAIDSCDTSLHDISEQGYARHDRKFAGGSQSQGSKVTTSQGQNFTKMSKNSYSHPQTQSTISLNWQDPLGVHSSVSRY